MLCLSSPFHFVCLFSRRRVDVFFLLPRYDVVRVYYKDTLVLQMYTTTPRTWFVLYIRLFFPLLFGHLSIQEESKQFVYEMCKWDMRRCDRDGIMEKTLIRLYHCCCCCCRCECYLRLENRFGSNFLFYLEKWKHMLLLMSFWWIPGKPQCLASVLAVRRCLWNWYKSADL